MGCFVAFLRGINVGGHIAKKDTLQNAFTSLGFQNTSLLIWPTPIGETEMLFLAIGLILASLAYPVYLFMNKQAAPNTI
jgi:hypothetical protein